MSFSDPWYTLDPIIQRDAIHVLNIALAQSVKDEIREMLWYPEGRSKIHEHWGTSLKGALRKRVCEDDALPSGNWDDYYMKAVEIACERLS